MIIKIEDKHTLYMKYLHNLLYKEGYCSHNFPKIKTKLIRKGKLIKIMILQTYNNNNYLNVYHKWYSDKNKKKFH